MHREPLKKKLSNYKGQPALVDNFIDFLNKHENCFERSNSYGHFTASCWLMDSSGEKVLLTHHRKLNMWLQPGGHCDGDSDVLRVALTEAEEETGISSWEFLDEEIFDIDCHQIPAFKDDPPHYHFDVRFVLVCKGDENYIVSDESHDLAWVHLDELSNYTQEESILRMARKWQSLVDVKK